MGFATLPNQVHRKSVKKGFDFTLMVAGRVGLWWWWFRGGLGGENIYMEGREEGKRKHLAMPFFAK